MPYIYEDRIKKEDFHNALSKIYNMTPDKRKKLGNEGRAHVLKNYNFEKLQEKWVEVIDSIVEENGSWDTRKNYNGIRFKEVA